MLRLTTLAAVLVITLPGCTCIGPALIQGLQGAAIASQHRVSSMAPPTQVACQTIYVYGLAQTSCRAY